MSAGRSTAIEAEVAALHDQIVATVLRDIPHAETLATQAIDLASSSGSEYAAAIARRAMGHVRYARADYSAALHCYQDAIQTFDRLGYHLDRARTQSGAMQTLIYLGRYEQAHQWADSAGLVFEQSGDRLRLARLDSNRGNIFYRQDRYQEALTLYWRAFEQFQIAGQPRDVAAALSNLAVCSISLHDFEQALDYYGRARTFCQQHDMRVLVAEADYNIAYLHFLRGEYTRAIALYQSARAYCEHAADPYHLALCDLDQAELFLELNLREEGAQMARQACDGFTRLGMGYERAKSLALLALAQSDTGSPRNAVHLFRQARTAFRAENNPVWAALIDLYQAMALVQWDRIVEARKYCRRALRYFEHSALVTKTALCELVLARIESRCANFPGALRYCQDALTRFAPTEHPSIAFYAQHLLGQIQEAMGLPDAAYESFSRARHSMETLRGRLAGDELKVAFLRDKSELYEHLLPFLRNSGRPDRDRLSFELIEQSKSRSLADLIAFRGQSIGLSSTRGRHELPIVKLRQELNGYYRQIELASLDIGEHARQKLASLWSLARDCEQKLTSRMAELRVLDREYASLHDASPIDSSRIQDALPEDAAIVEFFQAKRVLYAVLATRSTLRVCEIGPVQPVLEELRLLRFQLAKFRLGTDYLHSFRHALLRAVNEHLRFLHQHLIQPLLPHLSASHLIVVPHGILHHLPFHALSDGSAYLCDRFSLSYAPSASVFALCREKDPPSGNGSLVLAVPDAATPFIEQEARAAAAVLPHSRLFLGSEVTSDLLHTESPSARFLHIATHGEFRQDSPMFSSLRLSDSRLSLFDLYDLRLHAELVTLSGCSTGLSAIAGGDELIGLIRGLLHAGADAILLTLWDVNDAATANFVRVFYQQMLARNNKALALQEAMRQLRLTHPHPYYWAPFVILGNYVS